jgi:hypothetical protein
MIAILEARRQVRLHAADWAVEAIETYGTEAEGVMRYVQGGYGLAERYAFQQVRKAIRRRLNTPTIAEQIGAFLKDVALKGPTVGAR